MSPWLAIRTTVKAQGLVIQVARPFRGRVTAIGYDRLLLDPASLTFVRNDRLWLAAGLAAGGLLLSWPGLLGLRSVAGLATWVSDLTLLSSLLGPVLLGLAVLVLLYAVADPRRISVFLDREQVLHPKILLGNADDDAARAFIETIRQAIVRHRCEGRPLDGAADADTGAEAEGQPSLADTLDALLAMRQHGLLDEQELRRFQEFAERR